MRRRRGTVLAGEGPSGPAWADFGGVRGALTQAPPPSPSMGGTANTGEAGSRCWSEGGEGAARDDPSLKLLFHFRLFVVVAVVFATVPAGEGPAGAARGDSGEPRGASSQAPLPSSVVGDTTSTGEAGSRRWSEGAVRVARADPPLKLLFHFQLFITVAVLVLVK